MKKKIENKVIDARTQSGFVVMFISCIVLIVSITGGFVWSSNINFEIKKINKADILGNNLNATIKDLNSTDVDNIFNNLYTNALEVLSSGILYNTSRIDICPSSQKLINGEIYIEVCDSKYSTVSDIIDEYDEYLSTTYLNSIIDNNYIDYFGKLYLKPFDKQKKENYAGFNSYAVEYKTLNKIIYNVESKYGAYECYEDCNYTYETHKFIVTKENNKWVVSEFELPY